MPRRSSGRSGMALILALAAIVLAGGWRCTCRHGPGRWPAPSRPSWCASACGWPRPKPPGRRCGCWRPTRISGWITRRGLGAADGGHREDGVSTMAVVEDAGRFVNWNNLSVSNRATRTPREILLDLMTFCGDFEPVTCVEALQDYVDADGEGGFEAAFTRRLEPPREPPNRPLWAPEELLHCTVFR